MAYCSPSSPSYHFRLLLLEAATADFIHLYISSISDLVLKIFFLKEIGSFFLKDSYLLSS